MKIGIVGAGLVGSTTAYTLAMEGIVREIVLVDINRDRAVAEADDITHAAVYRHDCLISEGAYIDLRGADIVIITADGAPGFKQSRLELVEGNTEMFRTIIPKIVEFAPETILLIATNPVDVMTLVAYHLSGFPKNRVIGSGTVLDSSRFRSLLGRYFDISPQSLNAMVIGEHGDSAVVSWSTACVGSINIYRFAQKIGKPLTDEIKNALTGEVIDIAYKIYHGKKATYYGIAGALSTICRAIVGDEKKILTISSHHDDIEGFAQVCLSLPSVIGRSGVIKTLYPELSINEERKLKSSAEVLCRAQQESCTVLRS